MSVKVHEAFCMDSFMDRLLFFDDFHGDQLQDEWRVSTTGTVVVVDAQTGGIVRQTTGAVAWNTSLIDWNDIRSLHTDKKVTIEIRAKLTQTNAVISQILALRFDTDNRVFFYYDSGAGANWVLYCRDDAAQTTGDSGIAADTDYHIFRIECFPTGEVHFYIDGTECDNSPITTNIPDDAADFLQPYMWIQTREAVAKSMDMDYVYVRQER